MKSTPCSLFLKITLLIVSLTIYFGSSTYGQARDRTVLSRGPIRRTELPLGYLRVYSVTDEFSDGDAWYFSRSSFAIYTIDGKLFKNVESQHFADDEIPDVVALPVGTYTVVARSKRDGYVRILVLIKKGQQTILDLDLWEKKTQPI
jgi:hypothetical protein